MIHRVEEINDNFYFDYIGTGGFLIECQDTNREHENENDVTVNERRGNSEVAASATQVSSSATSSSIVGVTKEQAEIMMAKCPFFQRCFHHQDDDNTTMKMKECQERRIVKPDWSIAIVRHLIELLTKDKTSIPSLELYEEFCFALDQALVDARLCNFVNYIDPIPKLPCQPPLVLANATMTTPTHPASTTSFSFLDLAKDPEQYFSFVLHAVVTSKQWIHLLNAGILLNREYTNYVVRLAAAQTKDKENDSHEDPGEDAPTKHQEEEENLILSRRHLDSKFSDFRVHTVHPIQSLFKIQHLFAKEENTNMKADCSRHHRLNERYSVYFETTQSIPQKHNEMINRLAGGQAYVRTCAADTADFQTEGYTVEASFDVLQKALEPLVVNGTDATILCSLRVDHPSPDTLARLIHASHIATDFPGTIGLDCNIHRYFFRKSLRDIYSILNYMADFSKMASIEKPPAFAIHLLSSEEKPF